MGFVSKSNTFSTKAPNHEPSRVLQSLNTHQSFIYTAWRVFKTPEAVIGYMCPDMICPHLKSQTIFQTYQIYMEIENRLDAEREAQRKRDEQAREQKRLFDKYPNKRGAVKRA